VDDGEDVLLSLQERRSVVDRFWGEIEVANTLLGRPSLAPHLIGLV
jgi:hypothetical protein